MSSPAKQPASRHVTAHGIRRRPAEHVRVCLCAEAAMAHHPSSDLQMAVRDSLRFLSGARERDEADHHEHRDQCRADRLGGNRNP